MKTPDAEPEAIPSAGSVAPEPAENQQDHDKEIADFINRQVLEKDSVFFEG
jgi:hypothetical protein